MLFSLNCLVCTERISKNGKPYFVCGVVLPDGALGELFTYKAYKVGDKIPCTVSKRIIGNASFLVVVAANEQ